jgi:hypothetical protein
VRSAVYRERASRSYVPNSSRCTPWSRHVGITDEQAEAVVAEALAQHLIIGDGNNPPHNVALFRGLRE